MIKKTFLVCFFVCGISSYGHAQTMQEKFLRANQLYDDKEYKAAYEAYQLVEPKDSVVLYNMGNCSYRLGNYLQAIAEWHQAQKDAQPSLHEMARSNIAVAEKKINAAGQPFSVAACQSLQTVPLLWLQLMFLFIWFGFFFFLKNDNHGKKYRMFFLALLFLAIISCGILLVIQYKSLVQHKGIIMKSNVSLFAGPDEQYHVVTSLPQASCVEINEQRQEWYKIRYNNMAGWVHKDSLTVI